MRCNKGLGQNRFIQLSLVLALALVSFSGLIVPAIFASEDSVETAESVSEAKPETEPVDPPDQTPSADAPESSPEGNDEQSERGSSGQEEKPSVDDEPKKENRKRNEQKRSEEESEEQTSEKKKRIIGATAKILEKESGLIFKARVDTGAKSCSLHVEEMKVVGEVEGWKENIGKVVRFKVRNGSDKTKPIECRIKNYVLIKTSGHVERRYKVPLTLSWKGGAVEKKVLVTLNNRAGMDYPLLLGRNFLHGDFLVDVDLDSSD